MRNGKVHQNATNYANMKTRVENQLDRYDNAVANSPISLETINPLWAAKCDESTTAHDMYTSQPEMIQNIRNDLMVLNGGGKVYKCPLCEVNDVCHLDHYIPREKMPEFSVHPLNLIYLCHDCNEIKDTLWLDGAGNRIIFNAYYDRLSGKQLLVCNVNRVVNSLPWADVVENTAIVHNQDSLRELNTLKSLKINIMYESKVNDMLQTQCKLAIEQVRLFLNNGMDIDAAWNLLRKSYIKTLHSPLDVISRLTLQGMADSTVMKGWLVANVK